MRAAGAPTPEEFDLPEDTDEADEDATETPDPSWEHVPPMSQQPDDFDFNGFAPQDPAEHGGWQPQDFGPMQAGFFGGSATPSSRIGVGETPATYLWDQWKARKDDGGAYRIRIQYVTEEGERQEMGYMEMDSTHEMLIARFRKPGKFLVMPVDELDKPQLEQPKVINIAPDHIVLRRLTRYSGGVPGMGGGEMDVGGLLSFLASQEARRVHQDNAARAREDAQRDRLERDRQKVAEATANLAQTTTENSAALYAKLLEAANSQNEMARARDQQAYRDMLTQQKQSADSSVQLHKQGFESLAAILAQANENQRLAMEAERSRREALDKEDRERRQELAREEEDRRREFWKEMRTISDKRDTERRESLEREQDRIQKHHETMLALIQQKADNSNPITSLLGAITAAAPLMAAFGIQPGDAIGMIKDAFAGSAQKGFWGELFETVREVAKTAASAGGPDETIEVIEEGDEEDEPAQLEDHGGDVYFDMNTGLYINAAGQVVGQAPPGAVPAQGVPGAAFTHPIPQAAPQPAMPATPPSSPFGGWGEPSPATGAAQPSPADSLAPDIRKSGRRAVNRLVTELQSNDETKWLQITTEIFTENQNSLPPYLKAMTIRGAARDAGAPDELTNRFITLLDQLPIPALAEIPRG